MSEKTKLLRLLSLDGGGARGYSELVILDHLMRRIQQHEKLRSPPKPCDVFDMICGTGTGGIIALLLGRLRMNVEGAQHIYGKIAKEVFGGPKSHPSEGRFSATALEKVLKDAIIQYGQEGADAKLIPEGDIAAECTVFVCCQAALAMDHPCLFRSYRSFSVDEYLPLKIWEAARATSATPTLFKRIKIGPPYIQEEFIGGGMEVHNPADLLLEEIPTAFDDRHEIGCVISIGTGSTAVTLFSEPSTLQKMLLPDSTHLSKALAADCIRVENEVAKKFAATPGVYFRFNVDRGLDEIPVETFNELANVVSRTGNYLRDDEIVRSVDEAALVLCRPRDMTKGFDLCKS